MPGRTKKTAKGKPRPAGKATRKVTKKVAKKTAKKVTGKPAGKTARKMVKKATRKPPKKVAKPKRQAPPPGSAMEAKPGVGVAPKESVKSRVMQSRARVDELRSMLETKRAEISDEIKKAREDSMKNDHTSFPEVGDLVSASVEKERAFEHGEAGVNALREINAALEKLKSGTYGICEMCTKAIGVKRLKVMPSARLCIKCKSKEESSGGVSTGR
ncbi:MAG: TraR/DksA C4-type zinc finger protein [Candidatus Eisenbacteria bacterium]